MGLQYRKILAVILIDSISLPISTLSVYICYASFFAYSSTILFYFCPLSFWSLACEILSMDLMVDSKLCALCTKRAYDWMHWTKKVCTCFLSLNKLQQFQCFQKHMISFLLRVLLFLYTLYMFYLCSNILCEISNILMNTFAQMTELN